MTRESSVCMTEADEEEEEDGGHRCHKEIDTPPSSVVSSASSEHGGEKIKTDGSAESNNGQTSSPHDIPQLRPRRLYGPENYTSLLVNSHHPHEILAYDSSYDELRRKAIERAQAQAQVEFDGYDENQQEEEEDIQFDDAEAVCFQIHAIPANTVSFRHFRLQKFKYASISDVVVYHRSGSGSGSGSGNGKHQDGGHEGYDEAFEVARKVSVAQRKMLELRRSRGEVDALEYNVFVVVGKLRTPFTTVLEIRMDLNTDLSLSLLGIHENIFNRRLFCV